MSTAQHITTAAISMTLILRWAPFGAMRILRMRCCRKAKGC